MKETFNQRYKHVCRLAEQQAEAFAQVVSESFDDLDSLALCITIVVVERRRNYPKMNEATEDDNGLPKKSQRNGDPDDAAA